MLFTLFVYQPSPLFFWSDLMDVDMSDFWLGAFAFSFLLTASLANELM
jgi:hypothetical protein